MKLMLKVKKVLFLLKKKKKNPPKAKKFLTLFNTFFDQVNFYEME